MVKVALAVNEGRLQFLDSDDHFFCCVFLGIQIKAFNSYKFALSLKSMNFSKNS